MFCFLVDQVSLEQTKLPDWPASVIVQVSRICSTKPIISELFRQYVFESEHECELRSRCAKLVLSLVVIRPIVRHRYNLWIARCRPSPAPPFKIITLLAIALLIVFPSFMGLLPICLRERWAPGAIICTLPTKTIAIYSTLAN